jgi:hypothetical protein
VSSDLAINQELIARGFDGVAAIAGASRAEFVGQTTDLLGGDLKSATLHVNAAAQTAVLENAVADTLARRATATHNRPEPGRSVS